MMEARRYDVGGMAAAMALLIPTAMIVTALSFQHLGGLHPCEMCLWQRWPHYGAIALGCIALASKGRNRRMAVHLAALAIAASGVIGFYHAGVELGVFAGHTACTMPIRPVPGEDFLTAVMRMPITRCDVPAWTFMGVSMAGWNCVGSIVGAVVIMIASRRETWLQGR